MNIEHKKSEFLREGTALAQRRGGATYAEAFAEQSNRLRKLKAYCDRRGADLGLVLSGCMRMQLSDPNGGTPALDAILAALGVEDVAGARNKIAQMFQSVEALTNAFPELTQLLTPSSASFDSDDEEEESSMGARRGGGQPIVPTVITAWLSANGLRAVGAGAGGFLRSPAKAVTLSAQPAAAIAAPLSIEEQVAEASENPNMPGRNPFERALACAQRLGMLDGCDRNQMFMKTRTILQQGRSRLLSRQGAAAGGWR